MESHWLQEQDWHKYSTADESSEDHPHQTDTMSPGSYHCKSALRSHDDNMKLFLYRRSFHKLREIVGGDPYDDQYITLLPKIWRCFFNKDTGLDGDQNRTVSRQHSTPSPAFSSWADPQISSIIMEDILSQVISAERDIFEMDEASYDSLILAVKKFFKENSRLMYIMIFINYVLVVMNYKQNDRCPDISIDLPGVLFHMDSEVRRCRYNDFLEFTVGGDAILVSIPGYNQIIQKDLFLTLSDKMFERFNVLLGSTIIQAISSGEQDPDRSLGTLVELLLSTGDRILLSLRNRGFDLLSKFEAYCVATMLTHDDDRLWDSHEFLNNLLEDDAKENPDLYEYARALTTILSQASIHNLAEVHGLWRIWGHPIIDLEGGMRKMEATCLKQSNVDRRETSICTRTFKLTFFLNYYTKHNHYPLSNVTSKDKFEIYAGQLKDRDKVEYLANVLPPQDNSYIIKCLKEERKIDQHSSLYDHSDWDKIIILQSFQIPRSVNVATMIKDKAISMTRSELIDSVSKRRSVFDSTKRRGILRWLSSQAEKIIDFLTMVDHHGLEDNDRIIGLYPKEREMKTKARFFSLMSYKMRMYVTATEELLGKYILKYFPMITMSDTLLSMIIRLYDMTTGIGEHETKVTYSMNIDFSKWNQNMRERTNAGVFENLDRVLGFRKLISRTHDIFRNSYLYLCSGEYIPSIVNNHLTTQSPYSRINDESGKEGLRQKGWTITTVCDILSLAFKHKARIELIGGGDNQVLTVTFAMSKHLSKDGRTAQLNAIRKRMESFRNALAKKMEKRGLPLKLEETWISHKLLMYNKIMYYEGVPLKGRLKVISRLFSNSNVGVTSLGGITSTLGTGYQALSSKDYSPLLAWVTSRIFTYVYMVIYHKCNPITGSITLDRQIRKSIRNIKDGRSILGCMSVHDAPRKFKNMTNFETTGALSPEELFILVIYYHKILGGPGIGPPTSYIMKGFPDPLSEGLTFNYYIIKGSGNYKLRQYVKHLTMIERSHVMHWEHLLEDPVSINHNAPSHGVAALRSSAEKVVREAEIENREFKNLLKIGDNQYLKDLSEKLCSPHEIEPRILHDIVGATIPGYVNTIVSRVDQSTTINKLSNNADVVSEIYESEVFYYTFLGSKIKYPRGHVIGSCPTVDSKMLRNWTWNRKIIGVTTPHPFAYLSLELHTSSSPICDQNYITVYNKRDSAMWEIRRGQFRPYFGSYTEEKFKMTTLTAAYGDESVLRRAIKVQKLLGWRYQEGSTIYTLIQKILSCVTNADPNKFLPIREEITGDVEHRYHDMATKHGGIPTNLIQPYTTTSCNTSTFINHSKGAFNESLHFQAAIIYCCMKSILKKRNDNEVSEIHHFHESCNQCIMKVERPTGDDHIPQDVSLMSCPTNSLIYVNEEDIPIHYHSMIEFHKDQERKQQGETALDVQDPQPDRGSWIVLIASSLITGASIKRSTARLLLENLDTKEIMLILYCIQMYHSVKVSGIPPSKYTLLNMRALVEDHRQIIRDLISCKKISLLFHERRNLYAQNLEDDGLAVSMHTLIKESEEDLQNKSPAYWSAQSVKYQEPHRKIGLSVMAMLINKSMRSCDYCHSIVCSRISDRDEVVICHIHGELKTKIKYHLYSLDRLSKEKDNISIFQPMLGTCVYDQATLKRKGTLACMMDRAKRARLIRAKTMILKDIFYDTSALLELLGTSYPEWEGFSVSSTDQLTQYTMEDSNIMTITCNSNWVDETTSKYINMALSIFHALQITSRQLHKLQSNQEGHMTMVALIVPIDHQGALLLTRILVLVNDLCFTCNELKDPIKITLIPANITDLEEVDMSISSEVKLRLREGVDGREVIQIDDIGDGCLNLIELQKMVHCVISYDTSFRPAHKVPIYYLSTEDKLLTILHQMSLHPSYRRFNVKIVLPKFYVSSHRTGMISAEPCGIPKTINFLLARDLIANRFTHDHRDLSMVLAGKCISTTGSSVTIAMYEDVVGKGKPICDPKTRDSVIIAIKNRIRMEFLDYTGNSNMNWRQILLIKVLLSVLILTHQDGISALSYYTSFHDVSVSCSDSRKIILHKSSSTQVGRQNIGFSKGVLGNKLLPVFEELRGFIYITYKYPELLSNSILL
nr:RNA-dependent RNA polymerase [Paris yunnanensis betanucleorhabdovirus 1]